MAKQNSVTIRYGALGKTLIWHNPNGPDMHVDLEVFDSRGLTDIAHVMSQHLGLTIVAAAPHSGA